MKLIIIVASIIIVIYVKNKICEAIKKAVKSKTEKLVNKIKHPDILVNEAIRKVKEYYKNYDLNSEDKKEDTITYTKEESKEEPTTFKEKFKKAWYGDITYYEKQEEQKKENKSSVNKPKEEPKTFKEKFKEAWYGDMAYYDRLKEEQMHQETKKDNFYAEGIKEMTSNGTNLNINVDGVYRFVNKKLVDKNKNSEEYQKTYHK